MEFYGDSEFASGHQDDNSVPGICASMAHILTQTIRRNIYILTTDNIFVDTQPANSSIRLPDNAMAKGTTFGTQPVVHVRWQWLIFPATLLMMVVLATASTKLRSSHFGIPTWRASTIALMLHGPYSLVDGPLQDISTAEQMEHLAKHTKVSIQPTLRGWRLFEWETAKNAGSLAPDLSQTGKPTDGSARPLRERLANIFSSTARGADVSRV